MIQIHFSNNLPIIYDFSLIITFNLIGGQQYVKQSGGDFISWLCAISSLVFLVKAQIKNSVGLLIVQS